MPRPTRDDPNLILEERLWHRLNLHCWNSLSAAQETEGCCSNTEGRTHVSNHYSSTPELWVEYKGNKQLTQPQHKQMSLLQLVTLETWTNIRPSPWNDTPIRAPPIHSARNVLFLYGAGCEGFQLRKRSSGMCSWYIRVIQLGIRQVTGSRGAREGSRSQISEHRLHPVSMGPAEASSAIHWACPTFLALCCVTCIY